MIQNWYHVHFPGNHSGFASQTFLTTCDIYQKMTHLNTLIHCSGKLRVLPLLCTTQLQIWSSPPATSEEKQRTPFYGWGWTKRWLSSLVKNFAKPGPVEPKSTSPIRRYVLLQIPLLLLLLLLYDLDGLAHCSLTFTSTGRHQCCCWFNNAEGMMVAYYHIKSSTTGTERPTCSFERCRPVLLTSLLLFL